ncbi:MAG: OstA-like protein, partial [Paludibacter sp.]
MGIHLKAIPQLKYIVFGGVLCLFFAILTAQVRPGQLRKEILNNQQLKQNKPSTKSTSKQRKKTPFVFSQKPLAPIVNPLNNKQATLVYLENTETLAYDQFVNPDMKILKGNVRFKHDKAFLYCD